MKSPVSRLSPLPRPGLGALVLVGLIAGLFLGPAGARERKTPPPADAAEQLPAQPPPQPPQPPAEQTHV